MKQQQKQQQKQQEPQRHEKYEHEREPQRHSLGRETVGSCQPDRSAVRPRSGDHGSLPHHGTAQAGSVLAHGSAAALIPGGTAALSDTAATSNCSDQLSPESSATAAAILLLDGVSGRAGTGQIPQTGRDDLEGHVPDYADNHKVRAALDRIQAKIDKTKQLIEREQAANEENVKEYLALASAEQASSSSPSGALSMVTSISGSSTAARIKAGFERKNQKSAQTIAHLHRKLDEYNRQLEEIRASGRLSQGSSGGSAQLGGSAWGHGHRPAKNVLKDVGQGLKDFFVRDAARSREASPCGSRDASANSRDAAGGHHSSQGKHSKDATGFKNRNGSADNLAASSKTPLVNTQSSDDKLTVGPDVTFGLSDEDVSQSSLKSEPSDSASGEFHLSPRRGRHRPGTAPELRFNTSSADAGQADENLVASEPVADISESAGEVSAILAELQENQEIQRRLLATFNNLRDQFETETLIFHQALEDERERCERLEDQINDLGELHLHEITNIKQELASMQEKIEYQLDERTRDMQELLESCQTKISKMEMQQQHQQQLISMEGIENSNFRAILTKLINVMLAILAVILVLVSTLANFLGPFLTNRLRIISTVCLIGCLVAAWDNWSVLCDTIERITRRYGHPLFKT